MSDAVMDVAIDVVARGPKAEAARDYAVAKVRRALETAGAPVLYGRIKLGEAADPAVERPALAEAMLDVNGRPVRAHVAASTMTEAVDLLEERLRERVRHRVDRLRTLRRRDPASVAGEWRHSQAAAAVPAAPSWVERPAEERRVVRHKTLAPEPDGTRRGRLRHGDARRRLVPLHRPRVPAMPWCCGAGPAEATRPWRPCPD